MKRVLITGGTSGIGLETVKLLSGMDYEIILVGRNIDKLEAVQKKYPSCVKYYYTDLMDIDSIAPIFQSIEETGLLLDGLVHCAGVEGDLTPVRKCLYQRLESVMRIHFLSFVEMGKWFYKRKVSNDGSSMVGISSLAAIKCQRNVIDYASSKEALNVAAKVMSKEFIKRKIRVNTIMPAYVNTSMCADLEGTLDLNGVQPMGLIDPVQVAYLIEFLLSDKSLFLTGTTIPITGGMEY